MHALPLLLIPGLNCTALLWTAQVAAFGGQRAVSVVDHGGFDTMAAIAADILAKAPARFALAGLSMGGYVAMEMLRQAPERIDRLALLDTQAGADAAESAETRRRQIDIAASGGFARIPEIQLPRLLSDAHLQDPRLVGIVKRMAEDTGAASFIRQQTAILNRIDSRPSLGAVRCPALVLVGAEDKITPVERAREIHRAIPGGRLAIIADSGHLTTIEAPDAVNAELAAWLAA